MKWLLLAAGLALGAGPAPGADRPPNVLFIISDGLLVDLGCYGHPAARTPNLDRLAAEGVRFDRAYCQYPLCGPSRSSPPPGRRPDAVKVFVNEVSLRWALPAGPTLPEWFRNHGYHTARVGKIYHGGCPDGEEFHLPPGGTTDDPASWDSVYRPTGGVHDEKELAAKYGKYVANNWQWVASDRPDAQFTDHAAATEAIRLLEEKRDKPLFLALGFFKPHAPFVAPRRFAEAIPRLLPMMNRSVALSR